MAAPHKRAVTDMAEILEAEELACVRGQRLVFEDVCFRVARGGALLVQGPNGAGKSSLLRMIAGLLPVAHGKLLNPFRLAYLGHDNALKLGRTAEEELRFWARLDRAARPLDEVLDRFDLLALADVPIRMLSSGQRRRVALARLWQSGADLWLLDEATVGLDAASTARLAETMRAHRAAGGLIVAATHIPLGLEDADLLTLGTKSEGGQGAL